MSINPYLNNSKDKNNKTKQKLIIKKEIDKTPSPIETPYELICSNQNVSNNKSNQENTKPLLNVNDLPNEKDPQEPIFNNYPEFNYLKKLIPNTKKQRAKSANKLTNNNYPNYYNLINNNQNDIMDFSVNFDKTNYVNNIYLNNYKNNIIGKNTAAFGNTNKNLNTSNNYTMKVNDNINNLENMISTINNNGFHKYKKEIDNKKLILSQLENSIAILKNKISIYKNIKKDNLRHETKKKIKYENLRNVSKRYESIGKSVVNYKSEIPQIEEKICEIKNETIQINNLINMEQNEINLMKDNIRKLNKGISSIKKENDNLLPAIGLLKKHINTAKNKIDNIDKGQSNFLNKINGFSKKL